MKVIMTMTSDCASVADDKHVPRELNSLYGAEYMLLKDGDMFWSEKDIIDNCSHTSLPFDTDSRKTVTYLAVDRTQDHNAQEKTFLKNRKSMSLLRYS